MIRVPMHFLSKKDGYADWTHFCVLIIYVCLYLFILSHGLFIALAILDLSMNIKRMGHSPSSEVKAADLIPG